MPGAIIQKNNPANDPDMKPVKGHSMFKPGYSLFKTHRFGLIEPHMVGDVVPDDQKVSYRNTTDLDTYSLKTPLMGPVNLHKDSFFVPHKAIYPFNSDRILTNPTTGNDVPDDVTIGVTRSKFYKTPNSSSIYGTMKFPGFFNAFNQVVRGQTPSTWDSTDVAYATTAAWIHDLIMFTTYAHVRFLPIYSEGNLLNSLGLSSRHLITGFRTSDVVESRLSFDKSINQIWQYIANTVTGFAARIVKITISGGSRTCSYDTVYVCPGLTAAQKNSMIASVIDLHEFIDLLDQGEIVSEISNVTIRTGVADIGLPFSTWGIFSSYDHVITPFKINIDTYTSKPYSTLNLERAVAYQLVCASFYTDDHVDYVYDAKLWHENQNMIAYVAINGIGAGVVPTTQYNVGSFYYEYNGIRVPMDSCSRKIFDAVLDAEAALNIMQTSNSSTWGDAHLYMPSSNDYTTIGQIFYVIKYLYNVLGYQRSLKFRDYFVGSKPSPLAVGDVNVTVQSNLVNVVDVTKNIQMQRFLNQVNRTGRRIKDYIQGIFGSTPTVDDTLPVWLSSMESAIGAEETSNTGNSQMSQANSVTSKLRTDTNRFEFSMDVNNFGVLLGVTYFDLPRPYASATDRAFFVNNRFDIFNPFLQHIGDQEVYGQELSPLLPDNFAYQLRYSEYKQRYDRAVGGFADYLPGYAFVTDLHDLRNPLGVSALNDALEISPNFIRARSSEMNRFMLVNPDYTPAGYFHFIIRHDNQLSALRPMEPAPSIL